MSDGFDYIIAGAGSAGCILANRLSEDPANSVCLLEAGPPDRHPMIKIPLGIMYLMEHPRLNWRFWTIAQEATGGRPIYIPRGKTLGGSSSINGMVYMRGHRLDYDGWAAAGNEGWSYREVLPYFRKTENNEEFGETPYHGVGGPMNVINVESYNPLVDIMCEAARQMQMPLTEDFNGKQQEGFGKRQFTIRKGRRESTAKTFLHPVRHRGNLTVITRAMVERVTVEGKRATGIDVRVNGRHRRLEARKEVILSSGGKY
jgi:choline dehydrogenase-like flavoprotein